jgi:D-lactate dehydrogenase
MRIAVFSARTYDRDFLEAANLAAGSPHELSFHEAKLESATAVLAEGAVAVCPFVNDELGAETLAALRRIGVRLVALRSAGFNNVDLCAAAEMEIAVARVPAYSPHAVAEHTIALLLSLVRRIHRAYARVREGNLALDGLLGFDLAGRTAAVIGTGKIGKIVGQILDAFGCKVLGCDPLEDSTFAGTYVSFEEASRLFSPSIVP